MKLQVRSKLSNPMCLDSMRLFRSCREDCTYHLKPATCWSTGNGGVVASF